MRERDTLISKIRSFPGFETLGTPRFDTVTPLPGYLSSSSGNHCRWRFATFSSYSMTLHRLSSALPMSFTLCAQGALLACYPTGDRQTPRVEGPGAVSSLVVSHIHILCPFSPRHGPYSLGRRDGAVFLRLCFFVCPNTLRAHPGPCTRHIDTRSAVATSFQMTKR